MSICVLMIKDFTQKIGRWDQEFQTLRYDAYNLLCGISYAEWLIEMRYKKEPFYDYNLKEFITWARWRLSLRGRKEKRKYFDGSYV